MNIIRWLEMTINELEENLMQKKQVHKTAYFWSDVHISA